MSGRCSWLDTTRARLLVQLAATAAILGWAPGNLEKTALMLAVWVLGFKRIAKRELVVMAAVDVLFVVMNLAALQRGIFAFDHPDFLGMPLFEYLMWGFYTLHAIRFLDGATPRAGWTIAALAAGIFALPFAAIADPGWLLVASAAALVLALALFHEPMDLLYAGYMAGVGAVVEHVGVATGQWHYPAEPGGVPWWFIPMWAGVGLFTRRLLLPMVAHPAGRAPASR
jgi:hypothetical protein